MTKVITNNKLVLTSKSPRRKELLEKAGFNFRIVSKEVAEVYPEGLPVAEIPGFLAELKASAVLEEIDADEIILGADTIVVQDNIIYGKPKDREDAIQIITKLSGKVHEVITGVCLLTAKEKRVFSETTKVYFKILDDQEINHYVDHYKPYDKAGAYAIQEWIGLIGIEKIEGCYFNVVGLPVSRVYRELENW